MDRFRRSQTPAFERPKSVEPHAYALGRTRRGGSDPLPSPSSLGQQPQQRAMTPAPQQHHLHHARTRSLSISQPTPSPPMASSSSPSTSTSSSEENWRAKIHYEALQRFRRLAKEAEMAMQGKLARAGVSASSELGKKMAEEHRRTVEKLMEAMVEEEKVLVQKEERRQKKLKLSGPAGPESKAKTKGGVDDGGEEEWLWRPESRAGAADGKKNDRWIEAVRHEQQVLWDVIKRNAESPPSNPIPAVSKGKDGSSESAAKQDRRIRFAPDPRSPPPPRSATPSAPPLRSSTSLMNRPTVPLAFPATPRGSTPKPEEPVPIFHERWIPSVDHYAEEQREQEAAARTRSNSIIGNISIKKPRTSSFTTNSSDGSTSDTGGPGWRNWKQNVGVGNATAMASTSSTSSSTIRQSDLRRVQTPMPTGSARVYGGGSEAVRIPARPNSTRPGVEVGAPSSSPRSLGLYQKRLEEMEARLRRELSIRG